MQVVVEPLPRLDLGNAQTRSAVGEWREEEEAPDQSRDDDTRGSPGSKQRLSSNALPNGLAAGFLGDGLAALFGNGGNIGRLEVEDELDQSACNKRASEVCWQIMVKEELTAHDEEWNVVSGPCQEEEAGAVVQTRAGA